jgi:Glycosyl hydrolase catalytic core
VTVQIPTFLAKTVQENPISRATVLNFMKQALPWLEAQPWIAGYAWFPFGITQAVGTSSALFNEVGELTAAGRFYASLRAETPQGDQTITPDP